MNHKLHVGVPKITKAINETFSKLGKNLKSEDAVWRALKADKLRHCKIGTTYAMYQSQINKIADPDCTLFGLKGFAGRIGLTEDQVKYLKRKNSKKTNPLNLDWLDEICGTTACNPVSADNYKQRLNDTAEEQEGKRGRPRKMEWTDVS
jgi:DNA-binding Xre family transcriptional regulator